MKARKNRKIKRKERKEIKDSNITKEPRRFSYAFLTQGGKRYVKLKDSTFDRLYKKEQENIIKMAKYKNIDLRVINKEDWKTIMTGDEFGKKNYAYALGIARGTVMADLEDIAITNYVAGIKEMGNETLATRFKNIARYMKDKDYAKFEMFMLEIPDLFLFYKDKGRSHVKRQPTFNQNVAEDQLEELERVLKAYEDVIKEESGEDEDEDVDNEEE